MRLNLGGAKLTCRIACALGTYTVYGVAAAWAAPALFSFTQAHHWTSVPVYVLQDDEASGLMGLFPDPVQTQFEIGCDYLLFSIMYVPFFYQSRAPWVLLVFLLIFNEPLLIAGSFLSQLAGPR